MLFRYYYRIKILLPHAKWVVVSVIIMIDYHHSKMGTDTQWFTKSYARLSKSAGLDKTRRVGLDIADTLHIQFVRTEIHFCELLFSHSHKCSRRHWALCWRLRGLCEIQVNIVSWYESLHCSEVLSPPGGSWDLGRGPWTETHQLAPPACLTNTWQGSAVCKQ